MSVVKKEVGGNGHGVNPLAGSLSDARRNRKAVAAIGVTARGGRTVVAPRCRSSCSLSAARREKGGGSNNSRGVEPQAGPTHGPPWQKRQRQQRPR
ncbi:hypothetical protein NDU88_010339 [Pleurodeles waltl]|uniref:Uncharacterized protein n=1 Tax=Pleurodeles waltl TaxID=8319 RepID=A0AAV7RXZ2_PLEWA|nr:hypothetical protein NDU88_010339 [Pleurodeles waltl]